MNTTPPQPVKPSESADTKSPLSQASSPDTFGTLGSPGEVAWAAAVKRIGDFTILRVLGEGGMGTVYLAEDTRLDRKAAIKTMKPELAAKPENRQRFLREAKAAAAIEHDYVVPIWHVGEATDGSPFIAMPFLQGEMLESRLKREPVQNLGVILKVAREVSEGLAAAHARGLIHRDIKPSNIWIEGDPESKDLGQQVRRCKILDFGLARSQGLSDVHLTASGAILGTPAYMGPEQAGGDQVDHRTDLFSLGVMLYRMSTGKLPFAGPNAMAVLFALATVNPPPACNSNPNLPQALSDLIGRLMSKDPSKRPQSAAEVAAAVRQIVKDLQAKPSAPPLATAITPVEPSRAVNPWEDLTELEPAQAPMATPVRTKRNYTPLLFLVALLGLVPLPLGLWLATVFLRVETDKGTLVVEIDDDQVEARIKGGKLILTDVEGKDRYTLGPADRNEKIDAGPYKVRVEGADGLVLDTPEFTLKKGGKVTVRVTMKPKPVVKSIDPDRKAAEYVLSIGGGVKVNGQAQEIRLAADLPPEAFGLTGVDLRENNKVTDAGLTFFADCKNLIQLNLHGTKVTDAGVARFENCKNLTHLYLSSTKMTDTGLAHFAGCKNLERLELQYTKVSDAGLAHFKDCKNLIILGLEGPQVGDAGMAHFKNCKNLNQLYLAGTRVTDAGIAHFKDCKNLRYLYLNGTKVGDEGLDHFSNCKNLTILNLSATQVTDAGVAHFKDCKDLTDIRLLGTQVTDVGLAHLMDCKNLVYLELQKTKVTAAKIEELKKALPACRIEWDGGVIEPRATLDPDRKAAEYVLSIGGTVRVNEDGRDIKVAADLPKDPFRLPWINFNDNKQVSDAGLAVFEDCKNLRSIGFSQTQVSDAGLVHFKDCKNLTDLGLSGTKVSNVGLAHFKDSKNLRVLYLNGTQVTDAGLTYFKACKNLSHLYLHNTKVTDAGLATFKGCKNLALLQLDDTKVGNEGLAHFRECKGLEQLALRGTQVTDAGLAHFRDCKNLTHLTLQKTKVTATKIEELKKALPKCRIEWDGGVIESRATLDPDRKAAEYVLSIGGTVKVNDEDNREIKAAADLPKRPFRLTRVSLLGNIKVSDAGLAVFEGCENLTHLDLSGTQVADVGLTHLKDCQNLNFILLNSTQVGDTGLAHLKACKGLAGLGLSATKVTDAGLVHLRGRKSLTHLVLTNTKVTDAGLAHLKDCQNLLDFCLVGTKVTDAGLAHLKGCKSLRTLVVSDTRVSDAGLAHLKDCDNLGNINLSGTQVSDTGLAHLKGCKNIRSLDLSDTKVSDVGLTHLKAWENLISIHLSSTQVGDAGLAHLKGCKSLWTLGLSGTKVTDAGLVHFKDCKGLTHLMLQKTKVTAAKIEELRKALPACKIEWDGGVIEPKK